MFRKAILKAAGFSQACTCAWFRNRLQEEFCVDVPCIHARTIWTRKHRPVHGKRRWQSVPKVDFGLTRHSPQKWRNSTVREEEIAWCRLLHDQATNATLHTSGPHKLVFSCFVPMNWVSMPRRGNGRSPGRIIALTYVRVLDVVPRTFHGNLGRFRAAGVEVALVAEYPKCKRGLRPGMGR